MTASPSLQLELAVLVADPTRPLALGIAPDNTSLGWRPVRDWVEAGLPFAVPVAPWMLALDIDTPDAAAAADALIDRLTAQGREPVVVASGNPGHRHVFCWVPDPGEFARCVAVARSAGIDVRSESPIRPPGSPHRLGLAVEVLSHRSWDEALVSLVSRRPSPSTVHHLGFHAPADRDPLPATQLDRELAFSTTVPSPSLQRLIRFGHSEKRYIGHDGTPDDSRLLMAIANRAVIEQIPRIVLWGLLTAPGARGGASLTKRLSGAKGGAGGAGRRQAEAMFHRTYDTALRDCRTGARQIESRPDAVAYVAALARVARAVTWPGRRGASTRAVAVAVCELAARHQTITPRLPVRLVAETAGVHRDTAHRCLHELVGLGWLEVAGPWSETRGVCYRLKLPASLSDQLDTFEHLLAHSPLDTLTSVTERATSSTDLLPSRGRGTVRKSFDKLVEQPIVAPGHDVFAHVGLGKGVWRSFEAFVGGARTCLEVAELTGAHPGSVRRHAASLAAAGLLERCDDGWVVTRDVEADPACLDEAAVELGVDGVGHARKVRHLRERDGYRQFCERRMHARQHAAAADGRPDRFVARPRRQRTRWHVHPSLTAHPSWRPRTARHPVGARGSTPTSSDPPTPARR